MFKQPIFEAISLILGLAFELLTVGTRPASADFLLIDATNGYGWNRPTTTGGSATFQAWETFSSVGGPNASQTVFGAGSGVTSSVTTGTANATLGFGGAAGSTWSTVNSAGTPNAFDTSPVGTSFLTSGGNIYSPSGIVAPTITIPNNIDGVSGNNSTGHTAVTLQIRYQGSPPSLSSFTLFDPVSGLNVAPYRTPQLLASVPAGGFGGFIEDLLIDFYVAGNADLYSINFAAAGSSMSLDRIAVDTFFSANPIPFSTFGTAVPEPNSLVLLTTVGCLVALRRRRVA